MEDALTMERSSGGGVAVRLFAALAVDGTSGARLVDYGDALASRVQGGRGIERDGLHVTFAFLGDVAEEAVPLVAVALEAAAASVPGATAISTRGIASLDTDDVVAIDLDVELLVTLDAARDRLLANLATFAEHVDRRAWHPHVTVMHAPGEHGVRSSFPTGVPDPPAATWVADRLELFASIPSPVGRQHRLVHSVPLGGVPVGG